MKLRKYRTILLVLLLATCLIAFNFLYANKFNDFSSVDKDTTIVNAFQIQIDKYCNLLELMDSISKEIIANQVEVKRISSIVGKERNRKQHLQNELSYEKIDSCQIPIEKKIKSCIDEISNKEKLVDDKKRVNSKLQKTRDSCAKEIQTVLKKIQSQTTTIIGSKSIRFKKRTYNFFIADLDSDDLRLHLKDPVNNKSYSTINAVLNKLKLENLTPLMITNAGMYEPNLNPQGLYIENGRTMFNLDTTRPNSNNFYLKPNGVFYIDSLSVPHIDSTEAFQLLKKSANIKVKYATQSGPMLVINGRINSLFIRGSNNLKIRSGVGILSEKDKKVVFIISKDNANFYDFSNLFKDIFNCPNALFLDGSISMMYLRDINPNETGGFFGPMISITKKK